MRAASLILALSLFLGEASGEPAPPPTQAPPGPANTGDTHVASVNDAHAARQLTLTVKDSNNRPLAGIDVEIKVDGHEGITVVTDALGQLKFKRPKAKEVTVIVYPPDRSHFTKQIAVEDGVLDFTVQVAVDH